VSMKRVQQGLFLLSLLVASVLLIRFAVDFWIEMPALLALPFSLLVAATLAIAAMNLLLSLDEKGKKTISGPAKFLLLLAIPLGFLASTLDCSGLSFEGCTAFCTFIKLIWIPLIAIACAAYLFKESLGLLLMISLMSLVPLVPHCVCFNVGNGWWIERLGASPMCYVWGFAVSLLSASAIKSGRRAGLSLVVNLAIIGGALSFFISHHYFHFPW
jgi:hypothetical protein